MPFQFQAHTLPEKLASNDILHLIPGLYPEQLHIRLKERDASPYRVRKSCPADALIHSVDRIATQPHSLT